MTNDSLPLDPINPHDVIQAGIRLVKSQPRRRGLLTVTTDQGTFWLAKNRGGVLTVENDSGILTRTEEQAVAFFGRLPGRVGSVNFTQSHTMPDLRLYRDVELMVEIHLRDFRPRNQSSRYAPQLADIPTGNATPRDMFDAVAQVNVPPERAVYFVPNVMPDGRVSVYDYDTARNVLRYDPRTPLARRPVTASNLRRLRH